MLNIGLIGAGTVGGGVVKLLHSQAPFFRNVLGLPVHLHTIADKAVNRFPQLPVGNANCTDDADTVINDPDIRIVIELVGGTTFAKDIILRSLAKGKRVITANKALIAEHGPEIFQTAERHGVSVYFEAAVGGGMPVIKTIREALVGNEIHSVKTIINGTCNYILTQMSLQGLSFSNALAQAQAKGYAEADPSLDVGGGDSGHKVAIMASLIYGGYVPFNKISIEGISTLGHEDIAFARDLGYCIKLLGIMKRNPVNDACDVRVHPAMLRTDHILASVNDVFNAVLLEGDAVGQILLYGRGAGELPTASAVMSDIVDAARDIIGATPRRIPMSYYQTGNELPLKPIASIISRYYLRLGLVDVPGVLGTIAAIFGKHGISIASVMQRENLSQECVPVIFLTHTASEQNVRLALAEIAQLDMVKCAARVIRIEE
jgi:homoserine dehydrogenase